MSLATDNHSFLMDLCRLMSDSGFQEFKQKYIRDWSDMETVILFMNMYEYFSKEYFHRFHKPIEDQQMVTLLQFVFSNPKLRKKAIRVFRDYQSSLCTSFETHVRKHPLLSR